MTGSVSGYSRLLSTALGRSTSGITRLMRVTRRACASILGCGSRGSLDYILAVTCFATGTCCGVIERFPTNGNFTSLIFVPETGTYNEPTVMVRLGCGTSTSSTVSRVGGHECRKTLSKCDGRVLLIKVGCDGASSGGGRAYVVRDVGGLSWRGRWRGQASRTTHLL